MDGLVGRVVLVEMDPHLLGDGPQLRVDVLPFADAQEVEVLLLAHPAEGRRAALLLLLADVPPEIQIGEEVAGLVLEAGVLLVGLGLLVGRALTRVLDGQRGGYDHHLADTAVLVGLQDHACEPRVDGQLGELAAGVGQPLAYVLLRRVQRAQFLEELDAVADVAVVRRVDEGELLDVAEAGRGHLQDDGGEVRPQDLGVRELRAGVEVLFAVQADADAVGGTAAAALALVGAGLRDRLDGQPLDLGAMAVAGDAGEAGVDDVLDARDGEGGLGDVGRQNDPAPGVRLEHAVLLGVREPGVEGEHLGEAVVLLHQRVRGVTDLPLARRETRGCRPCPRPGAPRPRRRSR
ncbi:hypothetical protein RKD46_004530 [Streptomyces pseudovenezuelae]